jgi:hypothetical protein
MGALIAEVRSNAGTTGACIQMTTPNRYTRAANPVNTYTSVPASRDSVFTNVFIGAAIVPLEVKAVTLSVGAVSAGPLPPAVRRHQPLQRLPHLHLHMVDTAPDLYLLAQQEAAERPQQADFEVDDDR